MTFAGALDFFETMNFRMLLPLPALLIIFVPLLGLALWQFVRAQNWRGAGSRLAWARRTLMIVIVFVIGLAPSIPGAPDETFGRNIEVYFVVDRTGSMAAEDYDATGEAATNSDGEETTSGNTRLDGVRSDIRSIAEDLAGSKFSVITFDSSAASQLPLTNDGTAVRAWAETLRQEVTGQSQGSSVYAPLEVLRRNLQLGYERNPNFIRLVYYFTDGENTIPDVTLDSELAAQVMSLTDAGAVLLYGTEAGGQMRSYDGTDNPDQGWITDPANNNEPAISKADPQTATELANSLGIDFIHRDGGPTSAFTGGIDFETIAMDGRQWEAGTQDLYWPLVAVLGLLFGFELISFSPRRVKKTDHAEKSGTGAAAGTGPAAGTKTKRSKSAKNAARSTTTISTANAANASEVGGLQ